MLRPPSNWEVHLKPAFCELHVHVEGTLEPQTVFRLARRHGIELPWSSETELLDKYRFSDLQSFLNLYYANMTVLRSEDDFFELGRAFLKRVERAGVAHVEMFVDPQAHSARGLPVETVLRGLSRAADESSERYQMSAALIVCVVRDQPVDSAMRMLDEVLESSVPVLGIGLDSMEVGYPPRLFKRVFEQAAQAGLQLVAHAGEEGPPEYVWEALDVLGVSRIDHGIRAMEDAKLVDRLARDRIPLTVCPLSNVRLRAVDRVENLPIRDMLERDLLVTINSDDPAYFGGYIDDNLRAVRSAFGLGEEEMRLLAANSVEASFLSPEGKDRLLNQL